MALPPHHLGLHLQQSHHHHQQQNTHPFICGGFLSSDSQITSNLPFLTLSAAAEPPPPPDAYIPSVVDVMGLAPGGGEVGSDMWGEPARKRLREEELLENSQMSSIDFLQTRSVSTGLGLSLDDWRLAGSSSADSPLFPLFGDEISREVQRQDAEMDRFIKVQGERLKQTILEKMQAKQFQTIAMVEDKMFRKLRDKEAEVDSMNRKNLELEDKMKQLSVELDSWQYHARYNENMIAALRFNIQQILTQGRDSKEGCGDSEVEDTASCCNRQVVGLQVAPRKTGAGKEPMVCKMCRVNEVSMLLLPCRHLCLCKGCENKVSDCPVCQSSKLVGIEIYM